MLPGATTVNRPSRFKSLIARLAVACEQPIRRARSDIAIFARPFGFVFLQRVNHASEARKSNVCMMRSTKSLIS
jgi:hypothetical protein